MAKSGKNGKLEIGIGVTPNLGTELTDSGDHLTYEAAEGVRFSAIKTDTLGDLSPVLKADGVVRGGRVKIAVSGSVNVIDVTAITSSYIAGVESTLAAQTDVTVARPTVSDYLISSICLDYNAGTEQIAVIQGTEGSAFSETRDAAGGPPLLAVDHIELAQVRYTAQDAAAVSASEIIAIPNQHREESNFPAFTIDHLDGEVVANSAIMVNHTGPITKAVYIDYYTETTVEVPTVSTFTPPAKTFTSTKTNTYQGVVTTEAEEQSDGSFTALIDGTSTEIVSLISGTTAYFKFYPDKDLPEYKIGIGSYGVTEDFSADGAMTASITVVPKTAVVWDTD